MGVELMAKEPPKWERVARTEFVRTKIGADGTEKQTRWSYNDQDLGSLLGLGQQSLILLLQNQEGACKPKAIKVSLNSSYPTLIHEHEILQTIRNGVGTESTGIHLAINAYFPRAKRSEGPGDECLIMRKYATTLADKLSSLSTSEKLEAMCQIAQGLTTLHELGIAHRDIHMGNMMYDSKRKKWYLIDVTPRGKETMQDDVKYLVLCIAEALSEEADLIAQLKELSSAREVLQILTSYKK